MKSLLVERRELGGSIFECRLVPCGKDNCGKCPHGPYWYMLLRVKGGKFVKKYVGKLRPEGLR